ncbi:MAG: hypothetical protein LUQ50_05350 [Methanospirillum sp.]|uniref:hypothetical protein n=1 Tax=Methanospirillum sp. TaxID=45200 RepID=UPI002374D5D9|nr:hypothetical protein [Methanospirillum sp.]MDD1728479.1 hypothetical protein [Methanospirillum sp.]
MGALPGTDDQRAVSRSSPEKPEDLQDNEVERKAEGASVRPLHGVIDAGSMTGVYIDLKRCQVLWYVQSNVA